MGMREIQISDVSLISAPASVRVIELYVTLTHIGFGAKVDRDIHAKPLAYREFTDCARVSGSPVTISGYNGRSHTFKLNITDVGKAAYGDRYSYIHFFKSI